MSSSSTSLNAVCPYFTMFPIDFPLDVLSSLAKPGQSILDPFAGRGTTLYAGRLLGMRAHGVDSNPVAAAISVAKLVNTTPAQIVQTAQEILHDAPPASVPEGRFWEMAFERSVLSRLCRLRASLLDDCELPERQALRAILLGALHGPRNKIVLSYFSNQCTRTYAPKPAYAVRYWSRHGMEPPNVDVLSIIQRRALRYYGQEETLGAGSVTLADSTCASAFKSISDKVDWIVTSPPYYGMRTYLPDQWLRLWFVGGPDTVDYSTRGQLSHGSKEIFAEGLRRVWRNCERVASKQCRLVVRFGAINDRKVDPVQMISASLEDSGWCPVSIQPAGSASSGKRQAKQFVRARAAALEEIDVHALRA